MINIYIMKLKAFSEMVNTYEDDPGAWLRQAIKNGSNCGSRCKFLVDKLDNLKDRQLQQLMMIVFEHMVQNYHKNDHVEIDSGEWPGFFRSARQGGGKRKSKRTKRMARRSFRRTRRKRGGESIACTEDNECVNKGYRRCDDMEGECTNDVEGGRRRRRKSRRRSKGGIRWGISWGTVKPGKKCVKKLSGSQCTSGHKCMGEKGNRTCQPSTDSYSLRENMADGIVKAIGYETGGRRKKSRRRKKRRKRKRTKKKRRRRRRK